MQRIARLHLPHRDRARSRGFTLVELLIAVLVLGVLLAVALPSFNSSLRKGRRADAFASLTAVQQAQERWRSLHPAYAADTDLTVATPTGLGLASTTGSGAYGISITSFEPPDNAIGYVVTAAASSSGSQAADLACANMAVRVRSGNIQYGGSAGDIDWSLSNPDPNRCWAR
jgi:type IV pilus assembly protein PilE